MDFELWRSVVPFCWRTGPDAISGRKDSSQPGVVLRVLVEEARTQHFTFHELEVVFAIESPGASADGGVYPDRVEL